MDFLNNFFLPPSSDHLHLIKYIILLIYFIHIPFISLLLGGTFFSVFFRFLAGNNQLTNYWRVSKDFIETLIFPKTAGIILGVIPLFILTLIEGQIFYDAEILIVKFMMITTLLVATGITLVYFYRYTFIMSEIKPNLQLASGIIGLFILLSGYFIFSAVSALVLDPGRWPVINNISQFLFSWNVIARFLHFISASFAVSGTALLFFIFYWKELRKDIEPEYSLYLIRLGGGISLGFSLIQPLLLFWNLTTLPIPALTDEIFGFSVLGLFLLMFICISLYKLITDNRIKLIRNVFVLFIILLIVMIINDHYARESAIEDHTQLQVIRAEEVQARLEAEHDRLIETVVEPDLNIGKQVYNAQCNACHRFEEKLVGPAYNEVLPKYIDRQSDLVDFIRNPYKVDQNYPAMPKLGLSQKEIQSVVAYLFMTLRNNQ